MPRNSYAFKRQGGLVFVSTYQMLTTAYGQLIDGAWASRSDTVTLLDGPLAFSRAAAAAKALRRTARRWFRLPVRIAPICIKSFRN